MNKKIGNIFKGDKVIWMVFFFLCMISIVEVFSASSGLTYKSQNYVGPIAYHTFTILAGVVVAIITLNIPCRYFKLMTPFLILISVVTLLWVLLAGTKVGDAGRWINLFGFTFYIIGYSWICQALLVDDDKFVAYIPLVLILNAKWLSRNDGLRFTEAVTRCICDVRIAPFCSV